MFRIIGPTYPFRIYLYLIGCRWTGLFWVTSLDVKTFKERLTRQGLSDLDLRKFKLKEISEKPIDIKPD